MSCQDSWRPVSTSLTSYDASYSLHVMLEWTTKITSLSDDLFDRMTVIDLQSFVPWHFQPSGIKSELLQ